MKPRINVGGMIVVMLILCLLFATIAVLALYALCALCETIASYAATLSLSGHKRRLLSQLRRVGKPYWLDIYWEVYNELDSPCPDHGESCTPDNCLVKQAEKYEELVQACEAVDIKPWRIRLVT